MIKTQKGGITAPKGFTAAGIQAGFKRSRKDLALIFSGEPASAAGVFTANRAAAAPVLIDREQLSRSTVQRAFLINSGSANACTGTQGLADGRLSLQWTAEALGIPREQVLICSTGVIGKPLDMIRMAEGIPRAALNLARSNHGDAAQAIMTTDTFSKEHAVSFPVNGKPVTVGGMAKGSGMIRPNMATMLGFITTDAALAPDLLQTLLGSCVEQTFNRISVDNDMSTNDTVLMMANGCSGTPEIFAGTDAFHLFRQALLEVCMTLARMIVKDGEGANKLIGITVKGARTGAEALRAARSIADSMLVKTALHGEDANWGRVVAAVGGSGIDFCPERISMEIGRLSILQPGFRVVFDEQEAKAVLSAREIDLCIDLNQGLAQEQVWTTALSREYVAINGSYRS